MRRNRDTRGWTTVAAIAAGLHIGGAAAVFASGACPCATPPSGLAGWWRGEGNAEDSADGHDGSLKGGAAFATGVDGQAFHFDGVDDGITVPRSGGALDPDTGDFTVAAWINFTGDLPPLPNNAPHIFVNYNGNPYYALVVLASNERAEFSARDADEDRIFVQGTRALNDGQWHLVAGVRSGSSFLLYVDGVLDASGVNTALGSVTTGHHSCLYARIGAHHSDTGHCDTDTVKENFFPGLIDELMFFRRALSASEIASLHVQCATSPPSVTADAGPDQTVDEGESVTLDGSASRAQCGTPSYDWQQVAGIAVLLDTADPARPSFVAPEVAAGGETLSFALTVSSGADSSAPDTVDVVVKNLNHAPSADAGDDQVVSEGSLVGLDGSESFDPDGDALSFDWHQTAGTPVALSDPHAAAPSFEAPLVGRAGDTLVFELGVSDGQESRSDGVSVRVEDLNHAPAASAGADQSADELTGVTLDGTASEDPDGDALTYAWTQQSGTSVTLSDASAASPGFVAPAVGPGGESLVFRLVVTDGLAESAPDEVTVHVLSANDPPSCGLAQPSVPFLWPPNHKLVAVSVLGVNDPQDDAVTITVTQVRQDEAVNSSEDGDTSPDAVIQGAGALLRAERRGDGNGRVYRIDFDAEDGLGGRCSGSVTVSVPPSRKGTAVDGGPSVDSLSR